MINIPPYVGKILLEDMPIGTGFVVHNDGIVITSYHVIQSMPAMPAHTNLKFQLLNDSRLWDLEINETVDPLNDLALLTLRGPKLDIEIPHLIKSELAQSGMIFKIVGYAQVKDPVGANYNYTSAYGAIVGPMSRNGMDCIQLSTKDIWLGMSGAPIIVDELGGIVGVLSGRFFSDPNKSTIWRDTAWASMSDPIANLDRRIHLHSTHVKEKIKDLKYQTRVIELLRFTGYNITLGGQIDDIMVPILAETKSVLSNKYDIVGCREEHIDALINASNQRASNVIYIAENEKNVPERLKSFRNITIKYFSDLASNFIDFTPYIERIIYDFEHHTEISSKSSAPTRQPIIELMQRADLYRHYIPQNCRMLSNSNIEAQPILDYVENWLASDKSNHLTILGDFGSGKSSFCLYLTYILAQKYQNDPATSRVPLFISLRDYAKSISVQQMITDLLLNQYGIRFEGYTAFQRFLEAGRLILIFDGFDEMATKVDRRITFRNFDELNKLVIANSKIILTCRTQYFTDQSQIEEMLKSGGGSYLLTSIHERSNFDIVVLEEFTDDQVQSLLKSYYPENWGQYWNSVYNTLGFGDIARRPILLEMIIKTISEGFNTNNINLRGLNVAKLYDLYTQIWINRDDWRSILNSEGKRAFMESLAFDMWTNAKDSIYYKDLNKPIKSHFKDEIDTAQDVDYYDNDVRTSTFLTRDNQGNYQFLHRSFMEYFTASKCVSDLRDNHAILLSWKIRWFDNEIANFISKIIDKNDLGNLVDRIKTDRGEISGWNVAHIISLVCSQDSDEVIKLFPNLKALVEKQASVERDSVILRQYCRIIDALGGNAEIYIRRCVEIMESDITQSRTNIDTYLVYYRDEVNAANAMLRHLQASEFRYDNLLHLYVLGELGKWSHASELRELIRTQPKWKSKPEYERRALNVIERVRVRSNKEGVYHLGASDNLNALLSSKEININSASVNEIASLPSIGLKLAQRIITLRLQKGHFHTVNELLDVKGIGKAKLDKIKSIITI